MTDHEFELFPGRGDPAMNRQMNRLILAGAGRGEHATGGVDVLSGVPPEIARNCAALANVEAAVRRGASEEEIAVLNHALDTAVQAARAARQERARNADGTFAPSDGGSGFDGGVRRAVRPGRSMNEVFRSARQGSWEKRLAREAAPEWSIPLSP